MKTEEVLMLSKSIIGKNLLFESIPKGSFPTQKMSEDPTICDIGVECG